MRGKRENLFLVSSLALMAMLLVTGCDWEDGGEFNTSKGAGVNINISGMYSARSGELVTGVSISTMLITQIGNAIEVRDSNNSLYTGSVATPGVMGLGGSILGYPTGADMLQAQINFAGVNGLTKDDVQFVGIIRAVALEDVQGTTVTQTTTTDAVQTTATNNLGVTSIDIVAPPVTISDATTITAENSNGVVVENVNEATTTFVITEANTLFILEGHWVEGAVVGAVNGHARSSAGSFTTRATTTTP